MSKIDEKKEYIGLLKTYMSFLLAIMLAFGAGISKLYLVNNISILFLVGVLGILISTIIFVLIARKAHNEIKNLRNLKD